MGGPPLAAAAVAAATRPGGARRAEGGGAAGAAKVERPHPRAGRGTASVTKGGGLLVGLHTPASGRAGVLPAARDMARGEPGLQGTGGSGSCAGGGGRLPLQLVAK